MGAFDVIVSATAKKSQFVRASQFVRLRVRAHLGTSTAPATLLCFSFFLLNEARSFEAPVAAAPAQ